MFCFAWWLKIESWLGCEQFVLLGIYLVLIDPQLWGQAKTYDFPKWMGGWTSTRYHKITTTIIQLLMFTRPGVWVISIFQNFQNFVDEPFNLEIWLHPFLTPNPSAPVLHGGDYPRLFHISALDLGGSEQGDGIRRGCSVIVEAGNFGSPWKNMKKTTFTNHTEYLLHMVGVPSFYLVV